MPCSFLSVAVFGGLCAAALSPLHLYSFQADPVVEAVFEATSSPVVLSGRSPSECDASLDFTGANASSVALAIFPKGGQPCWTTKDARYSHSDFPIVLGVVRIGEQSLDAFEIQPPQSQASAFAASGQQVYVLLPGNVGFVKIPRDLSNSSVLSPGENEDGGYYSEEGIWQARSNRGVSFLTSKADLAESVSRLKTADLGGSILLLWEVWSDVHQRNEFMIVNAQGEPELAEAALAFPFNLPFADDLLIVNGKAVAYVGDPASWLVRFEFCYQDCDPPRSSGSSTSSDGGSTTLAAEASFSTREAGGLKVLLFALAGGLSGSYFA